MATLWLCLAAYTVIGLLVWWVGDLIDAVNEDGAEKARFLLGARRVAVAAAVIAGASGAAAVGVLVARRSAGSRRGGERRTGAVAAILLAALTAGLVAVIQVDADFGWAADGVLVLGFLAAALAAVATLARAALAAEPG
jgi:hypothetical protein